MNDWMKTTPRDLSKGERVKVDFDDGNEYIGVFEGYIRNIEGWEENEGSEVLEARDSYTLEFIDGPDVYLSDEPEKLSFRGRSTSLENLYVDGRFDIGDDAYEAAAKMLDWSGSQDSVEVRALDD